MITRFLSIAAPASIYVTMCVLALGLWRERRKFEWLALGPAAAGVLASFLLLPPVHRLFFDEDIYINIANNLSHAPVSQLTLLGSPKEASISTYYKEPAGWPVLLSLAFVVTGVSETAAFAAARILFGAAIAAVYQLAREITETRLQAVAASVLFAATPVCFWFSVSPGTDIPAALMSVLGMWGLIAGNAALAVGGLAMAAQTRMELIVLLPLIWLTGTIPRNWKALSAGLMATAFVHIAWVLSVSPILAEAERVPSGFALAYVPENLGHNITYLLSPWNFAAAATLAAIAAVVIKRGAGTMPMVWQIVSLFSVYLVFYAGSFRLNPRYSIQILVPLAVLAASLAGRPVYVAGLLATLIVPQVQPREFAGYHEALAADHRAALRFVSRIGPDDVVLSATPQMFMNQNRRAMDAVFASGRKELLEQELRSRVKAWYHAGPRTNILESVEARADRWMKSNFELHLIDSSEISGFRIAFYEVLLKPLNREAR